MLKLHKQLVFLKTRIDNREKKQTNLDEQQNCDIIMVIKQKKTENMIVLFMR